jgi:hypothetical protein
MSNARQWHGKHASSTIEAVFSAWSMQSSYKKCSAAQNSSRVKFWDASLPGDALGTELNWQFQNNG